MNGNCHFVVGTAAAAASVILMEPGTAEAVVLISTCIIGSLFPDIDNPQSHVGQLTAPVSTVIGAVSGRLGKSGSNHRSIFHDPVLYLALAWVTYVYCGGLFGFFLGVLSHLLLDALTPKGIPFLFFFRIRLGRIKSGGILSIAVSWFIAALMVAAAVVLRKRNFL